MVEILRNKLREKSTDGWEFTSKLILKCIFFFCVSRRYIFEIGKFYIYTLLFLQEHQNPMKPSHVLNFFQFEG